jgi:hypothetical protein
MLHAFITIFYLACFILRKHFIRHAYQGLQLMYIHTHTHTHTYTHTHAHTHDAGIVGYVMESGEQVFHALDEPDVTHTRTHTHMTQA